MGGSAGAHKETRRDFCVAKPRAHVLKSAKKANEAMVMVAKKVACSGVPVRPFTRPNQGGNRRSRENVWKMRDRPYTPAPVEEMMPTMAPRQTM